MQQNVLLAHSKYPEGWVEFSVSISFSLYLLTSQGHFIKQSTGFLLFSPTKWIRKSELKSTPVNTSNYILGSENKGDLVQKDVVMLVESLFTLWLQSLSGLNVFIWIDYIYIYAFSRCFYPKRLTVHLGYIFFCQYMCSLGIEPTTFALLTQCSTTEPWLISLIYNWYRLWKA